MTTGTKRRERDQDNESIICYKREKGTEERSRRKKKKESEREWERMSGKVDNVRIEMERKRD